MLFKELDVDKAIMYNGEIKLKEGLAKGIKIGVKKGRAEGRAEGIEIGVKKGRAEGIKIGKNNLRDTAIKMKRGGMTLKNISQYTGLSVSTIRQL
ncbi:hypothetical protein R80B4_00021 [Fibrobacteres bacterium R8-0-B4]